MLFYIVQNKRNKSCILFLRSITVRHISTLEIKWR